MCVTWFSRIQLVHGAICVEGMVEVHLPSMIQYKLIKQSSHTGFRWRSPPNNTPWGGPLTGHDHDGAEEACLSNWVPWYVPQRSDIQCRQKPECRQTRGKRRFHPMPWMGQSVVSQSCVPSMSSSLTWTTLGSSFPFSKTISNKHRQSSSGRPITKNCQPKGSKITSWWDWWSKCPTF